MKIGKITFCVPMKGKVVKPKRSSQEKRKASTKSAAAKKPKEASKASPISKLLCFLRRKNKVHIQATVSYY